MASADELRRFIENRLETYDPSIDLSLGGPADIQIVTPIVERLGSDPLEIDIPIFIRDRLVQEYPDLATDDGGLLEDILIKPLQLLLEPLKREVGIIRNNQSLVNAGTMNDEEADALAANWFESRKEGESSGGIVRIYFTSPTTARVTTDTLFSTPSGVNFFPTQHFSISSAQMSFQRQGSLYYMDITVQAEVPGLSGNVAKGEINNADVDGAVKVANLSAFTDGAPRETNEEFIARLGTVLTERSLSSKRGIGARVPQSFTSVRALQVVGAGEIGMDRDILKGTGEGFLHMSGKAVLYGDQLLISEVLYKDDGPDNTIRVQSGDLIRFQREDLVLDPSRIIYEATVSSIKSANEDSVNEAHLIALTSSIDLPETVVPPVKGFFSLFKPGFITISNVPGGISGDITVPENTVHLGGHTDVFIRPTDEQEEREVISDITDEDPLVALLNLQTKHYSNSFVANLNIVSSVLTTTQEAINFEERGIVVGDQLVIETGLYAGTYHILEVDGFNLFVDSVFEFYETQLRARVVRSLKVDLIQPKNIKLPFHQGSVNDLRTSVGSNLFRFDELDIQDFGAEVGDTIRILDGADSGDFIIKKFDPVLGGQGAIVDRVAGSSNTNIRYQVFKPGSGLILPLIRVKELEVLDASNQGTGTLIPYGDAVDIRALSDFEGAGKEIKVFEKNLLVFPDLLSRAGYPLWDTLSNDFIGTGSVTSATDARYTQKLESYDGVVRKITAWSGANPNPITQIEVNLPPFLFNGKRDSLIAFTTRKDITFTIDPTNSDHQTSDIAEAEIGDSITILDGPNQGSYIIQDLRVLELWATHEHGHRRIAIVQVDPELKVDPIRTGLEILKDTYTNGVGLYDSFTPEELVEIIQYSTYWDDPDGWYLRTALHTGTAADEGFISRLEYNLRLSSGIKLVVDGAGAVDIPASQAALAELLNSQARSGYYVGPSAKGKARVYFSDPVSAELYFGDNPTTFTKTLDSSKIYRLDMNQEPSQILPQSEVSTPPTEWNRDNTQVLTDRSYQFVTDGVAYATKGVRTDDIFEYHPAINDVLARRNMKSSYLGLTQRGSNVVQLLYPPKDQINNQSDLLPGQLLFIDSGPDLGAYVITQVVSEFSEWDLSGSGIPTIKVRVDRLLDSTTLSINQLVIRFDEGIAIKGTKRVNFGSSLAPGLIIAGMYLTIYAVIDDLSDLREATDGEVDVTGLQLTSTAIAFTVNDIGLWVESAGETTAKIVDVVGTTATLDTAWTTGVGITFKIRNLEEEIILSGDDEAHLGSFEIEYVDSPATYVLLNRDSNFPEFINSKVRWVAHTAPSVEPLSTSNGGTELTNQVVRIRHYDGVPRELSVEIPWSLTAAPTPLSQTAGQDEIKQLLLKDENGNPAIPLFDNSNIGYGHLLPYRIKRSGIKKISSTEMAKNREGSLYFVDLDLISYGPNEDMNLKENDSLILSGNRAILGYTLIVEDESFTYSTQERLSIKLPNSVLPVGSTPSLDNEIRLAGQNIQVVYNNATLVSDVQLFFDSPLDRTLVANVLVRHFLPMYVHIDLEYVGGSKEDIVSEDIISYVNNINPDSNLLTADSLIKIIKKRGATQVVLPISIVALVHGTDRRVRGMRSGNAIGPGAGFPEFKGTFQQSYFISGPDTSKLEIRPSGEQIFLTRR